MDVIRIGSGAGFSGDRVEPAVDLLARGELDDLVLECLAERTIALGQRRKLADPSIGYDAMLERRLEALLPSAVAVGTHLITNMGAANPLAAGEKARALSERLGLDARIGVVSGDDVLDRVDLSAPALEDGLPLEAHGAVISANAYLGADALMPALEADCQLVITGRVADPSLFLAPLAHRLGWDLRDPAAAAAGTLVGHLLECAGQLSGGYFADADRKQVPGLADLGFPFADVDRSGRAVYSKLPGSGGTVTRATVREQLLYEITDPSAYVTPDVVLDLRGTRVLDDGHDRVAVEGARGRPCPDALKVSVGYHAGHRAETEISYAGPRCRDRARLAAEVVDTRLRDAGLDLRVDLLGGGSGPERDQDCRLRIAAMGTKAAAEDLCLEVEALYTNGPAGGGGVRTRVDEVVGIVSTLIPRDDVVPQLDILEASLAHNPS